MLDVWRYVLGRFEHVVSVQVADLSATTTTVAQCRPFALLIEQDLLEFDAREFGALARDVGADVVTADMRDGKESIAAAVVPKLRAALARWRSREPPGRQ